MWCKTPSWRRTTTFPSSSSVLLSTTGFTASACTGAFEVIRNAAAKWPPSMKTWKGWRVSPPWIVRAKEEEAQFKEAALTALREERESMGGSLQGFADVKGCRGQKLRTDGGNVLHIPIGTVMSRLSRCKETLEKGLRKRLERE
jgi:hypothetical protein